MLVVAHLHLHSHGSHYSARYFTVWCRSEGPKEDGEKDHKKILVTAVF